MQTDGAARMDGQIDGDTHLMLCARDGDRTAFEKLYRKYSVVVMRYLTGRYDHIVSPADVVQEVFARLWAQRHKYRGHGRFKTYLLAHVRRVYLEEVRLHGRQEAMAERLRQDPKHAGLEAPEPAISSVEAHDVLEHTITLLTAKQRQALRLYYTEQMSLHDAAKSMGCTQKCFESRLLRGLKKLRHKIGGADPKYTPLPCAVQETPIRAKRERRNDRPCVTNI